MGKTQRPAGDAARRLAVLPPFLPSSFFVLGRSDFFGGLVNAADPRGLKQRNLFSFFLFSSFFSFSTAVTWLSFYWSEVKNSQRKRKRKKMDIIVQRHVSSQNVHRITRGYKSEMRTKVPPPKEEFDRRIFDPRSITADNGSAAVRSTVPPN